MTITTDRQYHAALQTARSFAAEAKDCRKVAKLLRQDIEDMNWEKRQALDMDARIERATTSAERLMARARSLRAEAAAFQRKHIALNGFRVP